MLAWNYWQPAHKSEQAAKDGVEGLPLPKRPSLAVLPFVNMSEDPKQEYFSDGFTEDLITELSKLPGLLVMARNSSFHYKGQAVNVKQVARELGVRFVLEGSVRRAAERLRISAQLIDAETGAHRWAERYDLGVQDLFAVQDEITKKIVAALKVQLTTEATERIRRGSTKSVEAWEQYAQGMQLLQEKSYSGHLLAQIYFESAIKLDPEFGAARLGLAWSWVREGRARGVTIPSGIEPLPEAERLAREVLKSNPSAAEPYAVLGQVFLRQRRHVEALQHARRAVALNPKSAEWRAYLAFTLVSSGMPEEGLREIGEAMRLSPFHPEWYASVMGLAQYLDAGYEEAITVLRGVLDRTARASRSWDQSSGLRFGGLRFGVALVLIASYAASDRVAEAHELVGFFRKYYPNLQPRAVLRTWWAFKEEATVDRIAADLRKAGLSE